MNNDIFNLKGRRSYIEGYSAPDSPYSLFMWGNGANAYDEIDGRAVWIHGTFGDADHSGIDGRYYEVAIDRNKALRNLYPCIEFVGEIRVHPSAQSLALARNWVRDSTGRIATFTYCNINVSFCRSMVYKRPGLQYARWSGTVEREWVANQIWRELITNSSQQPWGGGMDTQSWIRLDHKTAQHIANLGGFVLACSYNPNGSGHLVFLTEDPEFDLKTYDPSTTHGLNNCLSLKCFHCGSGMPRLTEAIEAFPVLQSYGQQSPPASLLDQVRLYCDKETWGEYCRYTSSCPVLTI